MSRRPAKKISTLGSRITSVVSVSLVLLVLGMLGVGAIVADTLSRSVREHVSVIVKMDPVMPDSAARAFGDVLTTAPYTASLSYMSADDVYEQEVVENPDIKEFGENPFQAEYEVVMQPGYVTADSVRAVSERLTAMPEVDEVVTRLDAVQTINATLHRLMTVLACIGGVLLLISLILIFNTINLSIYSRRFTINTMQLVGATASFIRAPFVRAAVVWGLASGVIASVLLNGVVLYGRGAGIEILDIPGWGSIAALCLALVLVGMLLCGCSAWIATSRYIGADDDDLYK